MNVLILGYFGGKNSGDSATLAGNIIAIDSATGQKNNYKVISTMRGTVSDIDCYIDRQIDFIWFDDLPRDIDLVVIANGGVPGAFVLNHVISALDNNIPVIATCIKAPIFPNTRLAAVWKAIMPDFKLCLTRLKRNEQLIRALGISNVNLACDFAAFNQSDSNFFPGYYLNDDRRFGAEQYAICFPRVTYHHYECSNQFQILWYTEFIKQNPALPILFASLGENDFEICSHFRFFKNVVILDLKHYQFRELLWLVQNCKAAISSGRFHGMIYALMTRRPCALITDRPGFVMDSVPTFGSDPSRFVALANDFNIPIIDRFSGLDRILDESKKIQYADFTALTVHTMALLKSSFSGALK